MLFPKHEIHRQGKSVCEKYLSTSNGPELKSAVVPKIGRRNLGCVPKEK